MSSKKYIISTLIILGLLLLGCATFVIVVDPSFHFHKPLSGLQYPMENEFYQNAGIARNFDYEAIIAGDSMTQNTKPSLIEELWGYKTVKIPNPGAPLIETDQCVKYALRSNKNLKLVIRQLDDLMLNKDPYLERYTEADKYLWDSNPFNDVKYIFAKETVVDALTVLTYTRAGKQTPTMDQYSNVVEDEDFGNFESLEKYLNRGYDFGYTDDTDTICARAVDNMQHNVIQTALDNPDVEFYYFVPPYSAPYWNEIINAGVLDKAIACQKAALSELLSVPNIKVFYFQNSFEIATDWSHYSDEVHVDEYTLDYMFTEMYAGNHLLTTDNIDTYINEVVDFYSNFDYQSLLVD